MKQRTINLKIRVKRKIMSNDLTRHRTKVAYIAGILDGEGCIYRNPQGKWIVGISNTNETLMSWLLESLPGSHVYTKKKDYKGRKVNCYYWQIGSQPDILVFLHAMLPFVIVKREKIIQCLEELSGTFTERLTKRIL